MTKEPPGIDVSTLRGWARLAIDGTVGLTHVVEAMHREIARPFPLPRARGPTPGLTGFVYRCIRGTARAIELACEVTLDQLGAQSRSGEPDPARRAEALRAALNGVAGDHLAATANPLAIEMRLRRGGQALALDSAALSRAIPAAARRVVVLIHGSCLDDLSWARAGHDHGAALERDLGYTAVYLQYNSGLHVSTNGRSLAALLDQLVRAWPVPLDSIAIVAHSMGGLVFRSACHYAAPGAAWPRLLEGCFFLGTPHLGAPLERGGNLVHAMLRVSRYSAPIALLAGIRSAGVTDLRHGSVLDDDWKDRDRFAHGAAGTKPVPLPEGARCFAIAGCTSRAAAILGDGLVSVRSALGMHRDPHRALAFPDERRWVARGVDHLGLLSDLGVYAYVRRSLEERAADEQVRAREG